MDFLKIFSSTVFSEIIFNGQEWVLVGTINWMLKQIYLDLNHND